MISKVDNWSLEFEIYGIEIFARILNFFFFQSIIFYCMKTKLTHYTNGMKLNAKGFEGSKLVNPNPFGILINSH